MSQPPYGSNQPPQQPYNQPPQQPYGQSPYGAPVEHPQAQTVFLLGILGFVVGILAFVAWYMGGKAKKEIEAGAPYPWDGKIKTGYLIGKVLGIIYIVFIALWFVMMIGGALLALNS